MRTRRCARLMCSWSHPLCTTFPCILWLSHYDSVISARKEQAQTIYSNKAGLLHFSHHVTFINWPSIEHIFDLHFNTLVAFLLVHVLICTILGIVEVFDKNNLYIGWTPKSGQFNLIGSYLSRFHPLKNIVRAHFLVCVCFSCVLWSAMATKGSNCWGLTFSQRSC